MVLLRDSGVNTAPDDVLVGGLLEIDEHAHRDLADEDHDQEHEELEEEEEDEVELTCSFWCVIHVCCVLTVPSIQVDSFQAPQHPKNPRKE